MSQLEALAKIVEDPYRWLERWRSTSGKKVIGCLGLYVPEELIHASGIHPAVIRELIIEPITESQRLLQPFFCGFAREITDIVLKGKLNYVEGIAAVDICTAMRGLIEMIQYRAPQISWVHPLNFPIPLKAKRSWQWMIQELYQFKKHLEKLSGQEITQNRLWESIGLYNYSRALMKCLYDLKCSQPWIISAGNIQTVIVSGMIMPKEEHCHILEGLLQELRSKEVTEKEHVRVIVSGSLCRCPGAGMLELIEDCGALVVYDDLYTGSRYWLTEVRSDGDPLESLAKAHLSMLAPCPTKYDPTNDLGEYLVEMFKRTKAQGVINILVKNCEMQAIYYPRVRAKLCEKGIPELCLQTEPGTLASTYKTRIEAFVEMIKRPI